MKFKLHNLPPNYISPKWYISFEGGNLRLLTDYKCLEIAISYIKIIYIIFIESNILNRLSTTISKIKSTYTRLKVKPLVRDHLCGVLVIGYGPDEWRVISGYGTDEWYHTL